MESKKISYCDFPEDMQDTLIEFQSAMNDEKAREDFFSQNDISENPFSGDDDDDDDVEVPF